MNPGEIAETLREQPFLEGFRPEHIEKLAGMASEVRFRKGQTIYREGDESSFFYLLTGATVALEVMTPTGPLRVQTLGKGDELGWSSVLEDKSKRFQARCLEDGEALAFDGARLLNACHEDCGFGYALMKRLVSVVEERLSATRLQLVDIYAPGKREVA